MNWQTSPTAAGNLLWDIKPRADLNGAEVASKDQAISSPASITAYAIGMKLVSGPIPALQPPNLNRLPGAGVVPVKPPPRVN